MKRITIDPITRLEGHGKIEIFLDGDGNVANAYFQVPELRGFESFCVGRAVEDMPVITNRICGVCPEAHHLASTKALDDLFGVEPPPAARKLRELLYMAFFVTDHTTHFYALGGPDFLVSPSAPPAERNILGLLRRVGLDAGKAVIACRARNHQVIQTLGGRGIHPVAGVPGGWSRPLREEERKGIETVAQENITFAMETLSLFDTHVFRNPAFTEALQSDIYLHRTYSMGTVDDRLRSNFYDGMIRVVDPDGAEFLRYHPRDYTRHLAERTEPWTYMKFPYLRRVGWKGFFDGADSGVYTATPLSRLNVSDGLATPRAQEEYERLYTSFGARRLGARFTPVHHRMATHWARLVELLYAAERMYELATDPEITSPRVRTIPDGLPGGADGGHTGIGSVEAPRGTLTHHYETDGRGVVTRVNMIVGTTNNHAAIAMSIRRAAERLIRGGRVVDEGLLNRIEMAFRLYDPCLSCATHALPGTMPLTVEIRDERGTLLRRIRREDRP